MDYHVFNRVYRDNPEYDVRAFTMAVEQNLGTVEGEMRPYPAVLAGKLYPKGIPTIPESDLQRFIIDNKIQLVVLAYSDIAYPDVCMLFFHINAQLILVTEVIKQQALHIQAYTSHA